MPPNKKGGKNYKKGKHGDDEPIVYERLEGQMYGRVVKLVGGCNALIYCNDNKERLCHIRGNMRKRVWLSSGDIVLISLRDLDQSDNNNNNNNNALSKIEKGDICAKYDQRVIYKLREKDKTINEKLFTIIEKTDGIGQKSKGIPDDTDGFIFDGEDESEDSTSESDENMPINRIAQRKTMATDDDIDIDNI